MDEDDDEGAGVRWFRLSQQLGGMELQRSSVKCVIKGKVTHPFLIKNIVRKAHDLPTMISRLYPTFRSRLFSFHIRRYKVAALENAGLAHILADSKI